MESSSNAVHLTKVRNRQGNLNKQLRLQGKEVIEKISAANMYDGEGETLEIPWEDFGQVLDGLERNEGLVLGVTGVDRFHITTNSESTKSGTIARTKEFFKYKNGGDLSVMLFDVDSNSARTFDDNDFINFIRELSSVAYAVGALSGAESIGYWRKGSGSSGLIVDGERLFNGNAHYYVAVRNMSEELVDTIFKWAWLNGWDSHLITKNGKVLPRTIIDRYVKDPCRISFEADFDVITDDTAVVEYMRENAELVEGGWVDGQALLEGLKILTSDFEIEWRKYREDSEIVNKAKAMAQAWVDKMAEKDVEAGRYDSKTKAKLARTSMLENQVVWSSTTLTRDDWSEIPVQDILLDWAEYEFSGWHGLTFRDPFEPEYGPSKAQLYVDEDGVRIHSFCHGSSVYRVLWDGSGLLRILEDATSISEEDLDLFVERMIPVAGDIKDRDVERMARLLRDKAEGVGVVVARREIRENLRPISGSDTESSEEETEGLWGLDEDATHGQITAAFLQAWEGNVAVFGHMLYRFDGKVWVKEKIGEMVNRISLMYSGRNFKKASDYRGVAGMIGDERMIRVEDWKEAPGVFCKDKFWMVDGKDVVPVRNKKEFYCRHRLEIDPDFEMETPLWDMFIDGFAVNEYGDQTRILKQMLGMVALRASVEAQVVPILWGEGGSGKSTLLQVLSALFDQDRVTAVPLGLLSTPEKAADLADAQINMTGELSARGKAMDMAGFKALTGQDRVMGRRLFKDPFYFTCRAAQIFSCNKLPSLSETDESIRRRLVLIRTRGRVREALPGLADRIIAEELPGVLARLIEWCKDGLQGLDLEISNELMNEWVISSNSVLSWFRSSCVLAEEGSVGVREMWESYLKWCQEENGGVAYGKYRFGEILETELGLSPGRGGRGKDQKRVWRGCWMVE